MKRLAGFAALIVAVSIPAFAQDSVIEQERADWQNCLIKTFAASLVQGTDKFTAVESSFPKCETEENSMFQTAHIASNGWLTRNDIAALQTVMRKQAKQALLGYASNMGY